MQAIRATPATRGMRAADPIGRSRSTVTMRRTRAQIVSELEAQGFHFRTFEIAHDSVHAVADWDWNQRDLPHIPFVHGGFRLASGVAEDGLAVGVYVQRILGVRLPVTVSFHHLHESPRARVYQAALGALVVVIGAELAPIPAGTRVSTVYSVGSLPATRLLLPAAEWLLRRNYQRLTEEDEPLRSRRRQLRGWGYAFAADTEGARYDRSLDLGRANVISPQAEAPPAQVAIGARDREILIGRDDHLGLRILSAGPRDRLRVFPRLCVHEGASLDGCAEREGALRCPWHGQRVAPVATFDREAPCAQVRETTHHRLELAGGVLHVAPRGSGSRSAADAASALQGVGGPHEPR
jgi:Rieske [2Fe-2S] domain